MSDDDAPKVLVPKDRVFGRSQGCWNCIHWDVERSKAVWTAKRQKDLEVALGIATKSRKGENDVRVVNIRRMVDSLDHLVASKGAGICLGSGETADGKPVGDFVMAAFLCHKWSGRQGASIAREGGKLDPLPEELRERVDEAVKVRDEGTPLIVKPDGDN